MIAGGMGQEKGGFIASCTSACFGWRLALNLGNKHRQEKNVKIYLMPDGFFTRERCMVVPPCI